MDPSKSLSSISLRNVLHFLLKVAGMLSWANFDFVRWPLQMKYIVSSAW